MDVVNSVTKGTQPEINNTILLKLNQECKVQIEDCFKVPIPKSQLAQPINKITKRRQSIRLLEKYIPCMKEASVKKTKKKPKKIYLNDIKENAIIAREGDSSETVNKHIANQYPELSDNDIVELMYQMTNFVESGVFDDTNMDWNDSISDLNLLCPMMPNESKNVYFPEMSVPAPVIDAPEFALQESQNEFVSGMSEPPSVNDLPELVPSESKNAFVAETPLPPTAADTPKFVQHESQNVFVSELSAPPSVCGVRELVPNESKKQFATDSIGAIDLSINKANSMNQILNPDMIDNVQQIDFESGKFIPDASYNMANRKQSLDPLLNRSVSIQTNFEDEKTVTQCCKCHNVEAGTLTTQSNNKQNIENVPTFQYASISGSNTLQQPAEKSVIDRQPKMIKRKSSLAIVKPRQTFMQSYNLNDCTVTSKVFPFKIPKLKKPNTDDKDLLKLDTKLARQSVKTVSTQTRAPLRSFLAPECNFDVMMTQVVKLLQRPCPKFLKSEDCGLFCSYNHLLPSKTMLGEAIKDWSNEQIHFLYTTYIQRYVICHLMYFQVVCNLFAERHLSDVILTTVKDCERFSLENNFQIIIFGLLRCGLSPDEALFKMCINSNRSVASINKILEIITSLNIVNFKRTIAFLSVEIETIDFNSSLANEVLRQASQVGVLDKIILEFCYCIIRKCISTETLNYDYVKMLWLKI